MFIGDNFLDNIYIHLKIIKIRRKMINNKIKKTHTHTHNNATPTTTNK